MTTNKLSLVPKQAPAAGHTPGRADRPHALLEPCVCNVPGLACLACLVCPRWVRHHGMVTTRRRAWCEQSLGGSALQQGGS